MTHNNQQEADRNYEQFERLLPSILHDHAGKFALMKSGEIRGFFLLQKMPRRQAL